MVTVRSQKRKHKYRTNTLEQVIKIVCGFGFFAYSWYIILDTTRKCNTGNGMITFQCGW